jgi:hypothetical protein
MNWDDPNLQPAEPPPASTRIGGFRRSIVVGTMAIGLLALGGVAAVSAADPSASPSTTAPSATDAPSATETPASTARPKGDCPEDGSGRRGNDDNDGTTPDTSPDVSNSDL